MSSDNDETIRDKYGVKKRVSIVWKYFQKLNRYRVRCKICAHEQNYQGTTGNILRHLKNKHSIDATIKGQGGAIADLNLDSFSGTGKAEDVKEKKDQDDDEEFDVTVKTEHNDVNIQTLSRQVVEMHSREVSYNDKADLNPYSEDNALEFSDYIQPHLLNDCNRKLSKISNLNDGGYQNGDSPSLLDHNTKCEMLEKRLIAEIEYFREKAAFYRMQKNLTSLQAKKVRYELDQMD